MSPLPAAAQRMRPAKVSTALLGTLIVAALAAGVFWIYKWQAKPSQPALQRSEYYLACADCKEVTMIPAAEARDRPNEGDKEYQCPKCNAFAARWVESPEAVAAEEAGIVPP